MVLGSGGHMSNPSFHHGAQVSGDLGIAANLLALSLPSPSISSKEESQQAFLTYANSQIAWLHQVLYQVYLQGTQQA